MQTLTIKINNESRTAFLIDLLKQFDFVSEIKLPTISKKRQKANEHSSLHLSELKEKYKHLPIVWGEGNADIADFVGIWKDKDISIEQIREKAWKRNW